MSYFKKIVERTLKVQVKANSGSVKPAIIPEFIPEPFETDTWGGRRTGRIMAYSTIGSAKKQPDKTRMHAKKQPDKTRMPVDEESMPEQLVGTSTAATGGRVRIAKQASKGAPEDKAVAADPVMMLEKKQAEVSPTEKVKKPDHGFVDAAFSAAEAVLHPVPGIASVDPDSLAKPLEPHGIGFTESPRPEHHPQLRPSTRALNDEYSMAVTQPDETSVTINIGRIEVRAVGPPVVETKALLRKEYSPPLPLGEYLKQRMEGKKNEP